ncbi:hypothetical protein ELI04_14880 [Rhizobium leguminosarum]|nr:hypothetical protein ELI04_14880 [Rhizobium leguminosarum]
MGLEDQMHALFSHSIPHIGDAIRNIMQPVAAQVRSVTVSTNTIAPAANSSSTRFGTNRLNSASLLTVYPKTLSSDPFIVESNRDKNEDVFIDNYIERRRDFLLPRPGGALFSQGEKPESFGKADYQKALASWQSAR